MEYNFKKCNCCVVGLQILVPFLLSSPRHRFSMKPCPHLGHLWSLQDMQLPDAPSGSPQLPCNCFPVSLSNVGFWMYFPAMLDDVIPPCCSNCTDSMLINCAGGIVCLYASPAAAPGPGKLFQVTALSGLFGFPCHLSAPDTGVSSPSGLSPCDRFLSHASLWLWPSWSLVLSEPVRNCRCPVSTCSVGPLFSLWAL